MSDETSRRKEDSDVSAEETIRVHGGLPLVQPTVDPRSSDVTMRVNPSDVGTRTVPAAPSDGGTRTIVARPSASFAAPALPSVFRYQVVDVLGRGGMGRVELAIDPNLGREVAIKTILAPNDAGLRGRFLEEARVAGQLEHPNIIPIHELGHDDHRGPYLVMKRIRGRSLKDVLAAIPGSPSPDRALADLLHSFIKVCEAIAYAHARGVIHRDLKPDNIMIGEFGEVVVMDWGLAKVLGSGEVSKSAPTVSDHGEGDSTTRTVAGDVLGTPLYMPPEQARGEVGTLDARADVYSLGATLYEILTLNSAFDATGVNELLVAVAAGRVLPPSKRHQAPWPLPRELEAVALKAMARDREARYPTATALKEDLEAWFAGRRLSAVEYTPWEALAKFARRHRTLLATGAVAFAVLVVVTVLFVIGLRASRDAAEDARARAEREEANARVQEANAREQERLARRRVAEGLVAQGDAFLMAGQTLDARLRYEESIAEFAAIGEESTAPSWGIAKALRASPPPILAVRGWNGPLSYVDISSDGRRFVTGGPKDPPTLCETATGRRVRVFDGGAATAVFARFAAGGKTLVTGHTDGTVHGFETETGAEGLVLKAQDSSLSFLVMRRDGAAFLTGADAFGSPVRAWDLSGKLLREVFAGSTRPLSADWSPDGTAFLVGYQDFVLRHWGPSGTDPVKELRGHGGYVWSVAWCPDGRHAFSGSGAGDVRLWDVETGETVLQARRHAQIIPGVFVAPDGLRAVSAGWDRTLLVWDLRMGRVIRTLRGHTDHIQRVVLTSDGKKAITVGDDRAALVWNVTENWEDGEIAVLGRTLERAAVSPDGKLLLACPQLPPVVSLVDLASRREIHRLTGHQAAVYDLAFFPDGRRAASASADGTVRVWDLAAGREALRLAGHKGMAMRVAVSEDGKRLATGDQFGGIFVWDAETGRLITTVQTRPNGGPGVCWVGALGLLPDGKRLVAGSTEERLRLWDIETGTTLRVLEEGKSIYFTGALSPDGRRFVVGGWLPEARLFDLDEEGPPRLLEGHRSSIQSIAWSPDGREVLTTSTDATARLWDATSGRETQTFQTYPGATEPITCGAFGPTPRQIFLVGPSGTVIELNGDLPARMRGFAPRVEAAISRLASEPGSAEALATLAEWYAFRGVWDWAAELFERARLAGASIDGRLLLTAYWRLDRAEDARRELARLREARELSPFDASLLLAGIARAEAHPKEIAATFVDPVPIGPGRREGRLSAESPRWEGRAIESFRLRGLEGERVTVRVRAEGFEPLVLIATPHQGVQWSVPGQQGDQVFTLHEAGDYLFGCTSLKPGCEGAFELELVVE
ncbi:MAG: protein kinase [Planctomycetota bacterium]